MTIQNKIDELKLDLIKDRLSYEEIFQRYLVDGNTYFFSTFIGDTNKEYKTKSLIADFFGVHIHEVVFVGSGKTGFSLNPKNLFNEFDNKFRSSNIIKDKSDLDIAIISPNLFDALSESIFNYTDSFKNKWTENEYYNGNKLEAFDVPICYKYFEYFSKGWFRPDMKPMGFEFCVNNSYQELKRKLYIEYGRKIGIGIYKNWYFFKDYHVNNLKNLYYKVKTDII